MCDAKCEYMLQATIFIRKLIYLDFEVFYELQWDSNFDVGYRRFRRPAVVLLSLLWIVTTCFINKHKQYIVKKLCKAEKECNY